MRILITALAILCVSSVVHVDAKLYTSIGRFVKQGVSRGVNPYATPHLKPLAVSSRQLSKSGHKGKSRYTSKSPSEFDDDDTKAWIDLEDVEDAEMNYPEITSANFVPAGEADFVYYI
eukprot:1064054_1